MHFHFAINPYGRANAGFGRRGIDKEDPGFQGQIQGYPHHRPNCLCHDREQGKIPGLRYG